MCVYVNVRFCIFVSLIFCMLSLVMYVSSVHRICYSCFGVLCISFTIFFSVAQRPNAGHGLLIHEVSRSHKVTHHSRQDSSGRVISPSQRPLPDNTQHSQQTNIHAPRRHSNPQFQEDISTFLNTVWCYFSVYIAFMHSSLPCIN